MIFNILLALALQPPAAVDVPVMIVNVPRLIAESMAGKTATARLQAFQIEKQKVLTDKQVEVQRLAATKVAVAQFEKAKLELERMTQDVQAEVTDLDRTLNDEFARRLRPIVAEIAEHDHVGVVLEYPQQMIFWVSPSVDITSKVIERLDAAANEKK